MCIRRLRELRHGRLRRLAPLWLLLGRGYRRMVRLLPSTPPVTVHIGCYGPFRVHAYFAFSNLAGWGEGHNAGFEKSVEACRKATCALDVGAHVGLVTLPMSSVMGKRGRVIAFEPAEANARLLEEHLLLNEVTNVEIVRAVVGAKPQDTVDFYELRNPSGMNSVISHRDPRKYRSTQRRQITLDFYCAEHDISPDVIKIDVEGAEIDVLEGAQTTLGRDRPLIFLSVHPKLLEQAGRSVSELRLYIDELGYKLVLPNGTPTETFTLGEYLMRPRDGASRQV